tara:strand:- start:367 stop:588 length:222 start_codon:yes stop_codon:yes gene_type:complete
MRASEVRTLSNNQLMKEIKDTRQEIMNLRFRAATKQLTNSSSERLAKKNLARLLTIQNENLLKENARGENGSS